jgi:nitric oxide reductase subunit B
MKSTRRLWRWLAAIFLVSFAVLGWIGHEIYLSAPPIPAQVISRDGQQVFGPGQVMQGQQAWLSAGGQQLGSVWGHGSYVAPDWSADWLHREAVALRDVLARQAFQVPYAALASDQQALIGARVKNELRRNTYDPVTGSLTLSAERAAVVRELSRHYTGLFGDDPALASLREQYAMVRHTLKDPADLQALPAFFFWSAWSSATDRPGETDLSYTSNWPHEPLVGNVPTTGTGIWSIVSVILLIAGVGALVWYHGIRARRRRRPTPPARPAVRAQTDRPRCAPRPSISMS